MRPIEFRLIRHDVIVGYEKHENGHIYHRKPKEDYGHYPICTNEWEFFIPHDSKDQYTGIDDKNGVKVWERDILRYKTNYLSLVEYCPCGSFKLRTDTRAGIRFYDMRSGVCEYDWDTPLEYHEIIGNIHTNPELLKKD